MKAKGARQVVLDTETTGLDIEEEHRIVEIACLELVARRITGERQHWLLNPQRDVSEEARRIHGLDNATLRERPLFEQIAEGLIEFIRGSELIVHNAEFDIGFLNAELSRCGEDWGRVGDHCQVLDTLALARAMHPGQRNSLDALCKRYNVDNSSRQLHGALLDAQLLAQVYLAMTSGQVMLGLQELDTSHEVELGRHRLQEDRPALRVIRPTKRERAAHRHRLEAIRKASGDRCLWDKRLD